MKLRQIALATAATFALAAPAFAADERQRDAGQPSQGAEERSQAHSPPNTSMGDRDRSAAQSQYNSGTIRGVQQALQEKGFEVGAVDGIWGPRTESALREFQQRQGMQANGRLDQQTLSALAVGETGPGARSNPEMGGGAPRANPSPAPEATQSGKSGVNRKDE